MDQIVGGGQKAGHMIVRAANEMYTSKIAANVVTRIVGNDVSPDGAQVWAGNRGDSTISVIDTGSMKAIDTFPTAKFVFRIRFTPDGKRVLATEPESNALRVYDAATCKLIPLDGLPVSVAIAPSGKLAYVAPARTASRCYDAARMARRPPNAWMVLVPATTSPP